MSFTFDKVAMLPESAMTDRSIRDLHALTCRYDQWVKSWAEEEKLRLEDNEKMFEERITKFK